MADLLAQMWRLWQRRNMARCVVCSSKEASETSQRFWNQKSQSFEEVVIEGRLLEFCSEHGEIVRRARVSQVSQLRSLFREAFGHRSLVERRAEYDRRIFPPRPEGRRREDGRRSTDSES